MNNNCNEDMCTIKSKAEIQAEEKLEKWIRELGLEEEVEDEDK